ncbi:MAG TPA: PIN domain-containing protein [Rhizomicrobium sp.]|jgi:predicted nucleic acid-binding protein
MAAIALADTSFLIALLDRRDGDHGWASSTATAHPPQWRTCEAVLSEAFHILGTEGEVALSALLQRDAILVTFNFHNERGPVLALLRKYAGLPMSFADACLVRMTEMVANSLVLTTDSDFRIYRRHGRQVIPSAMPET